MHRCRMLKVLVEMVDVLQHTLLPSNYDIVDSTEMLRVLWKPHAPRMRNDRDTEFARKKENGKDLVHAAQTAGVGLYDCERAGLQELLEYDAVLAHLAGCDADCAVRCVLEGFSDRCVTEDVVGGCGLFDEPGLELGQLFHV